MSLDPPVGRAVVGVDGCPAGWVAAVLVPSGTPRIAVHATFAGLLDSLPADAMLAVDMPIGLPDRIGPGGRGPERLVRPLLGARQSSVFAIPARAAVEAEPGPFASAAELYDAHRRASAIARATSEPPRAISIQAFNIFPRIRELDRLLRDRSELRHRVIESHPEVAFRHFNAAPLATPKKIRGAVNPAGLDERRALLSGCGWPPALLAAPPPPGAAADDVLDACAMMVVAARHCRGQTLSYPDPAPVDGHGLPVAIRV